MNITLGLITLVILILLVIRQIRVWKLRVFLSPGFYFGFLWILGVPGIIVFTQADIVPIYSSENMDELMSFIGFTGLCFLLLTKKGISKVNKESVVINYTSWKVYRILACLLFVAAVSEFFRLGGNLNMGAARFMANETQASRSTLVNYAIALALPLSIWAGNKTMSFVLKQSKPSIYTVFFLILPLFSNLILSITLGGRVDFVYCVAYYLIGVSLALPIRTSFRTIKKPIIIICISALIVVGFISGVSSQRAKHTQGVLDDKALFIEQEYPILSFLYGPIEYMTVTFIGYQYRRDDAVDLSNLGYGRYSLNGFINWTPPFASQFGLGDMSIAKALGVYYHPQETYDYKRIAYYVTHSCYIPIVKDFGPRGAYLFIIILVYIAHSLFVKIQTKQIILYSSTFYLFFLFWEYWVKSNYYGTLSSSILIPLYGFLIIDIVNYLFSPRNKPNYLKLFT